MAPIPARCRSGSEEGLNGMRRILDWFGEWLQIRTRITVSFGAGGIVRTHAAGNGASQCAVGVRWCLYAGRPGGAASQSAPGLALVLLWLASSWTARADIDDRL